MMTLSLSVVTAFVIIVAVIIADILCGDATNIRNVNNNPFSQIGYNNNNNAHPKSTTTPWPALGQRRNQQQISSAQQSNAQSNNNQPMWVRPNNSPNWVRNTPAPNLGTNRNTGSNPVKPSGSNNYNNNFLNNERGLQIGGPQIQKQGSNNLNANNGMRATTPTTNIAGLKPALPMGGGDTRTLNVNNNNDGMRGMMPAGSMNSGTGTSTQTGSQNQDSKTQNGDVQDFELREFSEELLTKDTNNPFRYVTINLQGKTTSRSTNDEAPLPLLSISNDAYSLPSIEKLMLLHNNYILESNQNEVYTAQEKIEENNLLDIIVTTPVMQHARNFLVKKGKIGKDPKEFKDLLRLIWFGMYSRGGGRIGSSGFEHIFLAEIKNSQVSGLHNWLYFNEEEKKRNANYLGYMKKIDLGNKGAILKYHFTFQEIDKPVGSMFIGTSPELEIALYSVCFVLRADKICPLKMNGNRFIIRTYTYRYRGKNMIGSAFPEI